MTQLFPNDQTRQIVADAVTQEKNILWILNQSQSLFFNPNVTAGNNTAGIFPTPTDGGVAFGADIVVQYANTGFAAAASQAGLHTWGGLLTETDDDKAMAAVVGDIVVVTHPVLG